MSDDLISRKAVLEEVRSFRCSITGLRAGKRVLARAADEYRKSILQIIEDQPTAFNKEKALEELKGEIELVVHKPMVAGRYIKKSRAIEVIEKGGI
ncbi:MAG TPA: hypothetical protein H9695_13355 [Candidatus Mediterraneibacter excrementigallinarum]|nr:hypothetical protein [Candidatus Mediterraneibacter excrementigallinarum]